MFYKAFTLAEVLITLGIIGIVAQVTIPTLTKNVQDSANKAVFKKMYTNLAQVVQFLAYDSGGGIDGQFGTTSDTFKTFFINSFKSIKTCDSGDSSCWTCSGKRTDDYFLSGNSVTTTSGLGWWYSTRPTIVLSDGSMINFAYLSSSCQGNNTGAIAPYAGTLCGALYVDVNGCKMPNAWGRDMFSIQIQKDKIFPQGPSFNNSTSMRCNKTDTLSGLLCAEYVIQNKDY